jgi:iron complex outermembrane recepter protein
LRHVLNGGFNVKSLRLILLAASSCLCAQPAFAQDATEAGAAAATAETSGPEMMDYSLEELLTLESTSVAKKRQEVGDSAAAVTIITQDDIRRSGASQLIDVLRLAPGVEVAQLDPNSAAVAVRGFNTRLSNSLLVMVDGRSVYVSALSGVFWDQQLVPLSDIERIEIVRGPGATMWGSNAVNGVINIITRQSVDTQGLRINANAGTHDRTASVTYGDISGETLSYRVYASGRHSDNLFDPAGNQLDGASRSVQTGVRLDYAPNERDTFTLQGDAQWGEFTGYSIRTQPVPRISQDRNSFSGQNIVARWTRRLQDMDIGVQAFVDNVNREELGVVVRQTTADIDSSLRWSPNETHELVFGLGARAVWDQTMGVPGQFDFTQSTDSNQWISGFVQDDIWLVRDRLRLSIGTKLEYNTITGTEFQPSFRVLWRPIDDVTLWAAYSRATRLPARYERTVQYHAVIPPQTPENPSPFPIFSSSLGHPNLTGVSLDAFEFGLRVNLAQGWALDIATYYNDYRHVIGVVPGTPTPIGFPPVALQLVSQIDNALTARSYGGEVSLRGNITDDWRVTAQYSYLNLRFDSANPAAQSLTSAGASPEHQFSIRSQWDVGDRIEVDALLRYVDGLRDQAVPSYFDLGGRVSYRVNDVLELGIVGRNLLDERRTEFGQRNFPVLQTFVPRSVAATIAARF